MKTALIGHSGFVGSNISSQWRFDYYFNSSNINQIEGQEYDLIICAGTPGTKWVANQNSSEDSAKIGQLEKSLRNVSAGSILLISTIDVYPTPHGVTEDTSINASDLDAYGQNRLKFERFIQSKFPKVSVVRLPGLYGEGLKKNILFDLITQTNLDKVPREGFCQFYPLSRIGEDLDLVLHNKIETINFATEPISISEILDIFETTGGNSQIIPPNYDMRTNHARLWGNRKNYMMNKAEVSANLKRFICSYNTQ